MKNLEIDLENCYGIKRLKHNFAFSQSNCVLIYAPNGVMKSSLAKTFTCIAKDEKPCDLIFRERKSKYEILVDNKPIEPKSIFVADPDTEINSDAKISSLLASKKLKVQYDEIYSGLELYKNEFLKKLKEKTQSSDCESEVISVFKKNDKETLFSCLLNIEKEIIKEHKFYNFRYNDIFDKKGNVEKFLDKNKELIQQYFSSYKDLLEKSKFFKSNESGVSFGTYQANLLLNSIADDSFFYANHKIILSDNSEIKSKEQLQKIYKDEIDKIFDDKKLKNSFDKIDKAIGANTELRAFKSIIEKDKTIIPLLLNYAEFRKQVWFGFFYSLKEDTIELIKVYKNQVKKLTDLLSEAKKENETWKKIIDIYNDRFFVPFVISIKNQEDIILKQETANLVFNYKEKEGISVEKQKDEILTVLSKGEKRAFFILQLIFEIEARKKSEGENLIVLDDIADSFDYKNKYAIIEYIRDLNEDNNFKQIILTHNFDFYRTIASRLSLSHSEVFMAIVSDNGIDLKKGQYRKDVFDYFTDNAMQEKIFVSLIPFVRNVIEYTKGVDSNEYKKLTSCLHIKEDSSSITVKDICEIFINNIEKCKNLVTRTFESIKIIDLIKKVAEDIIKEKQIDDILLENKLVISIAIRLITEEFLMLKLTNKEQLNEIKRNQTRVLIDSYKKLPNKDYEVINVLERVNLMTPENIHVNSFMYEPLIDMSINHLIKLYDDVKKLK